MTPPRPLLALITTAGVIVIAGCANTSHPTRATPVATPRASTSRGAQAGRAAAASAFAGAYVRYLAGAGAASALPDATSVVRALAGHAGPLPAGSRRGTFVLAGLYGVHGQPGAYVLAARDAAHTFYATITVSREHSQWLVSALAPPDFEQALAPPGSQAPAPPPGSGAPERAARAFLHGYLPWLYGQGPPPATEDATTNLIASLERQPPRVPPTMRSLHPKLAALALVRHRDGWQALPNITDGRETYELVLTITQTGGRWLVSAVSNSR